MLSFIGCGSAFAVKNKNNSAFFIDKNTLNLFDCGETVFESIINKNILKGIKKVNIFLSHLHSDHCGSLGTFVFFLSAKGLDRKNIKIIFPDKKQGNILLKIFGIKKDCVLINKCKNFNDFTVKSFRQRHYDIISYGYLVKFNKKSFYFTGDLSKINIKILKLFLQGNIDEIYIDADLLNRGGKFHLEFDTIKKIFPKNLRDRVICMHLHDDYNKEQIKKEGFKLPNII